MRVRYIDNFSKEGELDLDRVQPGDSVRFIADFRKIAGPKGVVFVPKDTVGEVTGVGPESLRVLATGAREATGDLESSDMEVEVEPHVVAVLVDERDERLNNHRIDDAQRVAQTRTRTRTQTPQGVLELWDLELALMDGLRDGWPMWRRRAAIRCLRGPARTFACRTTDRAWRALVAGLGYARSGLGYARSAARLPSGADVGVLRQAEQMMAEAFVAAHGRSADLSQRSDALWLVDELYAHVARESGEDQLRLEEDESGALTPHGPGFDEFTLDEGPGGSLMPASGPFGHPALWERELERIDDTRQAIRSTPDPAWASETAHLRRLPAGGGSEAESQGPWPPVGFGSHEPISPELESRLDQAMEESVMRQRSQPTPGTAPAVRSESPSAPASGSARTPILWKSQEKWVIATPDMPVFVKNKGHGTITDVRPDAITADLGGQLVTADPRLVYLHAREPLPGMEFATLPEVGEMKRRMDRRRHGSCYVTRTSPTDLGRRIALGPLGVSELKRWLTYPDEFAIISGYKDTQTSKANQTKHGELMQALQKLGYSPGQIRPLRGQYMNQAGAMQAEQSILILGMSLTDALEVGRQLNQESIIYKSPEGVLGAYWTDGSGEVRLALNEDDIAVGDQGVQVRPRAPKEMHRGPPSPKDPWSKARSVGFEFPIDWGRSFKTKPGQPVTLQDARRQLGLTEVGQGDVEAGAY